MLVAGLCQQVRQTTAFMSANFKPVVAYAKVAISQGPHSASPSYSSTAATLDIQQG